MKRDLYIGAAFLTTLAALGLGSHELTRRAVVEAAGVQAPRFEVDPMWPKPLPNHWIMGQTIGVSVSVTSPAPQLSGATTTAYLGTFSPAQELLSGALDDVRIYNVALTAKQVAQLAAGRYAGTGVSATWTLGANTTVSGQLILPLVGDLAEEGDRGRVVGLVTSGVLSGILVL